MQKKKSKLSSNGGDSGSKKCKRGCGGTCGVVWQSAFSGGLECSVLAHLAGISLPLP
jgi:hypothetical protein